MQSGCLKMGFLLASLRAELSAMLCLAGWSDALLGLARVHLCSVERS